MGNAAQGKYCGTSPPQPLETTSHFMYVKFISDGSNNAAGFSMVFNEVQVTCGGHLTLSNSVTSGYFTSPNYPSNYTHNVECVWIITAPANERIQIDFDERFRIENHMRYICQQRWDKILFCICKLMLIKKTAIQKMYKKQSQKKTKWQNIYFTLIFMPFLGKKGTAYFWGLCVYLSIHPISVVNLGLIYLYVNVSF